MSEEDNTIEIRVKSPKMIIKIIGYYIILIFPYIFLDAYIYQDIIFHEN